MKRALPIMVILIGIILRWDSLNWDRPYYFHPDEVRLLYAINDISWQNVNPKFFAYGSLPIYLLKVVNEAGKVLAQKTALNQFLATLTERPLAIDDFFLLGRAISALFGSLTLLLLYVFGKRFFSRRVALLSTAFLAFTVLHIQLSHFLTVDVMLTFFILLAVYFMTALVAKQAANRSALTFSLAQEEQRQWFALCRNYLYAGIAIGLALATKISALPLYGVFLGAHVLALVNHPLFKGRPGRLRLWGIFLGALLLSGLVFFLCEPYAFFDFKEFYRQTKEQSNMVRGLAQPPFVIQYEQTTPYLYPLQHLLRYGMGLPLGLLTLLGSLWLTLAICARFKVCLTNRRRGFDAYFTNSDRALIVILLWVWPVFLSVGGFKVKFLRYLLPLIPFWCLLGAIWVEQLMQRRPAWKLVIYTLVSGVIGFSAFYATAFMTIYHRLDPRVQASQWIYEHIQPGATILTEEWEFVSFVPVPGRNPGQYASQGLDLYRPDSAEKIQQLAQQLSRGDVIFLATKRLYGSILRVPERYPLTVHYYQQLFDGNLGFTPVKPFTKYPALFGVTFNDDLADESFAVYEHPKVILFQKTQPLSARELYQRIITAPQVSDPAGLLKRLTAFPALEEAAPAPAAKAAGFSNSRPAWQTVVIWLLAVEILAGLAWPLTMLTFRNAPPLGYAVAKIAGLLLPAYVAWLLVSLKFLPYTNGVLWGAPGVLLVVALLVGRQHRPFLTELVRTCWRTFLLQEEVFLLAFGAFLVFRAYNPDIFWSESSMDFSFLNVLSRTETLPPPDPWIAGAPLNYYYFGHYLVAMLTRLTAIPPQIAYNLAFALFPALVILEVFSLLYQLTGRFRWGFIGVFGATLSGNPDGFLLLLNTWTCKLFLSLRPFIPIDLGWQAREGYYRFFRCAHEVIPYTVHEFPFWTFIFTDLHAHLLNMPVLLAVFLFGFNLLAEDANRAPFDKLRANGIDWGRMSAACLPILLVGTLGVISSWDYPTGVIFLLLIAALKTYRHFRQGERRLKTLLRPLAYVLGVLIPGSLLLYMPFYRSFSRSGMGIGLVGAETTRLADLLLFFGFFCFIILSFLLWQAWQLRKNGSPGRVCLGLVGLAFTGHVLAWLAFHVNYATLIFALAMLLLSSYLFAKQAAGRIASTVADAYIALCLGYACLIIAGCELVFVRDFLQGGEWKRMNTIFKFYLPTWLLLAFVATYMLAQLEQHAVLRPRLMPGSASRWDLRKFWRLSLGVLFLLSAVFTVMGPYARRHQDVYNRAWLPPTFDGLAYLQATNPDESQAIRWLNAHVAGTPVILEATGADYLYEYARISANTGLPTVLGWQSHVEQREHRGETHQRIADIKEIYTSLTLERVLLLLKQYHVAYIYIGETEWRDFPEAGLKKFQNDPASFELAFQSGRTSIYRVK